MNRKRLARRLAKIAKCRIPIIYDEDYYAHHREGKYRLIAIRHEDTELNNESMELENAQFDFTESLFYKHGVSCPHDIFAILHEIGHVMLPLKNNEEYARDVLLLERLFCAGLLDAHRYIEQYNAIPDEHDANMWAIEWLKKNKKIIFELRKEK